jgi:hypothetical protein
LGYSLGDFFPQTHPVTLLACSQHGRAHRLSQGETFSDEKSTRGFSPFPPFLLAAELLCLSVCPFVRLSVCPFVRLSVCLFVCLSVCPFVRLPVCPFVRLPVCQVSRFPTFSFFQTFLFISSVAE